jgi:adenylosuccinate synthase
MSTIDIVTGAQYGSEGKGHITAQLAQYYKEQPGHMTTNIRVAGPNAGHTVIDIDGNTFPLRTIPVAAAINHEADLYIAPGSEIDLDVLQHEVNNLREHGHPVRNLFVSGEATLLTEGHKQTEIEKQMHQAIGSTAKGIGAARADRIMRTAERIQDSWAARTLIFALKGQILSHPEHLLYIANQLHQPDRHILIEGTQGYGLGLHAGRYPQCTSSDARAIDFLAMAGISPWAPGVERTVPWMVARVYPIRVAGNSGPLEGETSWEELGLPEEHTTVTHKVRRVGEWDAKLIREATLANGTVPHQYQVNWMTHGSPGRIALTMVDQKIPQLAGLTNLDNVDDDTYDQTINLIKDVENTAGVRVGMVTTSPTTAIWSESWTT